MASPGYNPKMQFASSLILNDRKFELLRIIA